MGDGENTHADFRAWSPDTEYASVRGKTLGKHGIKQKMKGNCIPKVDVTEIQMILIRFDVKFQRLTRVFYSDINISGGGTCMKQRKILC